MFADSFLSPFHIVVLYVVAAIHGICFVLTLVTVPHQSGATAAAAAVQLFTFAPTVTYAFHQCCGRRVDRCILPPNVYFRQRNV